MRTGLTLSLVVGGAVFGTLLTALPMRSQSSSGAPATQELAPVRAHDALAPDHVAGRVLSSVDKHPIAHATVTLREHQGRRPLAVTRTDAEGRYAFGPQPSGKYNLHASAPGYLGSSYLEHEGFSTAIVLGAGLKTGDLTLQITPSAVITGRVVDEAGDPVQHASLTLFREDPNAASANTALSSGRLLARTRTAQAADDGSFEFSGVTPGQFYLSASATPWYAVHPRADSSDSASSDARYLPYRVAVDPALDVAYPELFYPHATSPEDATPFLVKPGDRITADMVMQPEHALTLTFRMPAAEPGQPQNFRYPQLSRTVFGVEQPVPGQNSFGEGRSFTITGLLPGQYILRQFAPNSRFATDIGSVTLGDEPVSMDLPTEAAQNSGSVSVTLREANGTALPSGLRLLLRRTDNNGSPEENRVVEKDVTEFANLPAGEYRFTVLGESRTLPVVALAQDGKPVRSKRLHIAGPNPVHIDLTLSLYAPVLEGFAQHEGKGMPGAMVILVPAGADTSEELFRRDQSDLDGSFVLPNVVPGNYLLIAIENGWSLRWNDPAALLPYLLHALPVAVPRSGAATVHLPDPVTTQRR